jgi:hypothetical protein
MNFAMNKVNRDRRRNNLNGWEPLSMGSILSLTSMFTFRVKMTFLSFFWILPVIS